MRHRGVLHPELAAALARLGHGDAVVVSDAGLPRPRGVHVIDLAVTFGVPSFEEVVTLLADELVVESVLVARETDEQNPAALAVVHARIGAPQLTDHEQLKAASGQATLMVRTGEATAYANAILTCGVPF